MKYLTDLFAARFVLKTLRDLCPGYCGQELNTEYLITSKLLVRDKYFKYIFTLDNYKN